jgi:hypothetical protein
MADRTNSPLQIGNDPFLDKLDFLNTGAQLPDDEDLFLFYGLSKEAQYGNSNRKSGRPENANGQYSSFPGATPKYARHIPGRNRENYDTLARMFIRIPQDGRAENIRKALRSKVSQDVAKVMLEDKSADQPALGYVDFFLDSIQTNLAEKVQVTEVLEDNFVAFFFGASPPTEVFTGHLMNTIQDDWAVQMLSAYQDLFRGTMLARRRLQLYIRYDSYIVSGACTGLSFTRSSQNENIIPFSLQMLVHRKHLLYGNVFGATKLPASAGSFVPTDAYELLEPKVKQLRPLIAKAAAVPTDGINALTCEDDFTAMRDLAGDDVALDASQSSGQSEASDPTRPGAWTGPEPRYVNASVPRLELKTEMPGYKPFVGLDF